MELKRASVDDLDKIWRMQKEAFAELLDKYQDFETSPGSEAKERVEAKLLQEYTYFYYIVQDEQTVGAIRVVDKQDGSRKRISPLFIMQQYRNRGFAQKAIEAAEEKHGKDNWELATILQEEMNCYLYEKMGYKKTGKTEKINGKMDIVYYEKN